MNLLCKSGHVDEKENPRFGGLYFLYLIKLHSSYGHCLSSPHLMSNVTQGRSQTSKYINISGLSGLELLKKGTYSVLSCEINRFACQKWSIIAGFLYVSPKQLFNRISVNGFKGIWGSMQPLFGPEMGTWVSNSII